MAAFVSKDVFRTHRQVDRQKKQVIVVRVIQEQREGYASYVGADGKEKSAAAQKIVERHIQQARRYHREKNLSRVPVEAKECAAQDGIRGQDDGEGNAW